MLTILVIIFIIGYVAIAFEHAIKINKTASALLTGVLCWVVYIFASSDKEIVSEQLYGHFGEIASILFFLLSAMTIVELIDLHDGFDVITSRIKTKNIRRLLWIICFVTFFLSAILDNLTSTIVMVTLLRKLIQDKNTRLFFIGMVVVAANAGGAWTPIGDVTTTMLWIGGQITAGNIIVKLIIPSLVCLLVPLSIVSFTLKGEIEPIEVTEVEIQEKTNNSERNLILAMGIAALIFVPVFKTVTHLPPFMGIFIHWRCYGLLQKLFTKTKTTRKKVFTQ